MIRDFINYNSEIFIKTIELMKKHKLYSFYYEKNATPDEYDDEDFYEVAIEICNRLCGEYDYFSTKDEIYKSIEDVFNYWHGNIAKNNIKLKKKIRKFGDEIYKYYKKKQRKKRMQDKTRRLSNL